LSRANKAGCDDPPTRKVVLLCGRGDSSALLEERSAGDVWLVKVDSAGL